MIATKCCLIAFLLLTSDVHSKRGRVSDSSSAVLSADGHVIVNTTKSKYLIMGEHQNQWKWSEDKAQLQFSYRFGTYHNAFVYTAYMCPQGCDPQEMCGVCDPKDVTHKGCVVQCGEPHCVQVTPSCRDKTNQKEAVQCAKRWKLYMKNDFEKASPVNDSNVIRVFDVGDFEPTTNDIKESALFMECAYGNLLVHINSHTPHKLEAKQATAIALQLAKGLAATHAAGIVHLFLVLENVFCTVKDDGCKKVKLTSFGFSRNTLTDCPVENVDSMRQPCGASSGSVLTDRKISAPETASGMYNFKSDVYSLGILWIEIMSGKNPSDRHPSDFLFGAERVGMRPEEHLQTYYHSDNMKAFWVASEKGCQDKLQEHPEAFAATFLSYSNTCNIVKEGVREKMKMARPHQGATAWKKKYLHFEWTKAGFVYINEQRQKGFNTITTYFDYPAFGAGSLVTLDQLSTGKDYQLSTGKKFFTRFTLQNLQDDGYIVPRKSYYVSGAVTTPEQLQHAIDELPLALDTRFRDLIKRMTQHDHRERPTATEVVETIEVVEKMMRASL